MRLRECLLMLAAGLACSDPASSDLFSVRGRVAGVVRTAGGTPVPGVAVAVRAAALGGPAAGRVLDTATTVTDAAGAYALELGVLNAPDQKAALSLRAAPPAGLGLAPLDTAGLRLRLARGAPGTAVVDLTFVAAPE